MIVMFIFPGPAVPPKQLKDIKISKNASAPEKRRRTEDDLGKVVHRRTEVHPVSLQESLLLRQDIFNANMETPMPTAASVLTPSNFGSSGSPPLAHDSLPDFLCENDPRLVPSTIISARTRPLPLADMPLQGSPAALEANMRFSYEEVCNIETDTRGQHNNVNWFQQRRGSLTASNFSDFRRFTQGAKISEERLVTEVLGKRVKYMKVPKCPNKDCLKWGHTGEIKARIEYRDDQAKKHKGLKILDCGLLVSETNPYLRCSPDGIVICDCHPKSPKLFEIKSPYTSRNDSWATVAAENKLPYLDTTGPEVVLKNTPNFGYLDQVQGSMALTGIQQCDFVIHTTENKVLPILFDRSYWETELFPALQSFWISSIAPSIIRQNTPHLVIQPEEGDSLTAGIDFLDSLSDSEFESQSTIVKTENAAPQSMVMPVLSSQTMPGNDGATHCTVCLILLPEADFVQEDNRNASVGCECSCGCPTWYCWPCARYTTEDSEEGDPWFCFQCVRNCEGVYLNV